MSGFSLERFFSSNYKKSLFDAEKAEYPETDLQPTQEVMVAETCQRLLPVDRTFTFGAPPP